MGLRRLARVPWPTPTRQWPGSWPSGWRRGTPSSTPRTIRCCAARALAAGAGEPGGGQGRRLRL
eukprot:5322745-Alexandrium_andersonii.AAC.1